MFQKAINDIQIFLRKNEGFFDKKIEFIKKANHSSSMFDDLNYVNNIIYPNGLTFSYKKLYYILFWYLGVTRNLINILQKNERRFLWLKSFFYSEFHDNVSGYRYGLVDCFSTNLKDKIHPLKMKRFNNYKIRFIYNCLLYLSNSKIMKNYIIITIKNSEDIVWVKNFLNLTNDIYYFDENLLIQNNYGDNFNYRINTLKIIIQHFDNLQTEGRNITDKKRDIISIYYYIIILMPFSLGTASIAEMFLYSLWKFYIGTRLEIRQTIMLDVEALLNTFDIFYKNCFTNDDKENDPVILRQIYGYDEATYKPIRYTPYLVESKLNINLTGFGGLFGLD